MSAAASLPPARGLQHLRVLRMKGAPWIRQPWPSWPPMMQQYMQVKQQVPDCILFYRLGDFYEMFFEDAELASRAGAHPTGRDCGLETRAPHVRRALPRSGQLPGPPGGEGL